MSCAVITVVSFNWTEVREYAFLTEKPAMVRIALYDNRASKDGQDFVRIAEAVDFDVQRQASSLLLWKLTKFPSSFTRPPRPESDGVDENGAMGDVEDVFVEELP